MIDNLSSVRNKLDKTADGYSSNQCSLLVRVNGDELEVPLNFGMTSDEIVKLYPYILQFASVCIKNPSVEFGVDESSGKYAELSDEQLSAVVNKVNLQSRYWYGKSEASLLEIAIRFALDIKLRGIQELLDIFEPESTLDKFKKDGVDPVSDEEAEQIIRDLGLETDVDHEFDPGDEKDIPLGIAGQLHVNLYDSGFDEEDFVSSELDDLEEHLDVADKFEEMLEEHSEDEYKSHYDGTKIDESMIKNGLLVQSDKSGGEQVNLYGSSDEQSSGPTVDEEIDKLFGLDEDGEINEEFDGGVDLYGDTADGIDWDSEDDDFDDGAS